MQQINLYTDAFKPPKVKLPLEQIIAFPLIILLILIASSFALSSYLNDQKNELSIFQAKRADMSARLNVLNEKAEKLRQDDGLIAANQRLNKTLIARKNMISTLDRVVVKEAEGFSSTLIALARQKEEGLWLTSILLGGNKKQMVLEGITTKAELVPAYLQNLRQESSFLGRNFSLFELNENESSRTLLGFTLKAEETGLGNPMDVQPMIQNMDEEMNDSLKGAVNEP